jgi:hypothetical protein
MGGIAYQLYDLFIPPAWHVIQEQGEYDGQREGKERIKADRNGIPQNTKKTGRRHKPLEMPQPDPGAVGKRPDRGIVLKSYLYPINGYVLKEDEIGQGKGDQKVEPPVLP